LRRSLILATAALISGAALPAATSPAEASWVRVQFAGRITQEARSGLEDSGLRFLQYTPTNAYLGYATPAAAEAADEVPSVTTVRPLRPAEKISALLAGRRGPVAVAVIAAADSGGVAANLDALGTVRGTFDLRGDGALALIEAVVDGSDVAALSRLAPVLHVGRTGMRWSLEDEGATQVLAGNVVNGRPVAGYEQFLSGLGLDGQGVKIAVVDDGIDDTHPEFFGRGVQRVTYGPFSQGPPEGHGTHVAGIVGGRGAFIGAQGVGTRARDAEGLLYGIGVAPAVGLIDQPAIQVTHTTLGDFPPTGGFEAYTRDAVRLGAIGWNASWTDGGGTGVGYNANAANLDALTRDADTATPGLQPFTFVFSAGNSGSSGTTSRITSPKEAKNIIAVASSRGHRAGDVDTISSFSSRGPARDGRIVPTVAAPGETIMSARAATGVLCTAPLSGNVDDSPPPDGFTLYTGCSGTSMASPQVAGSVALIHDWWRERNTGDDPSPAMDKALLVNTATDLKTPDIPNRNEGWGRVNLRALFDPAASRIYADESVVLTDPGQAHSLNVTPADPTQPLRVTLVWTDPPGVPAEDPKTPALVNDLDLTVVTGAGLTYRGNTFKAGQSLPDGPPDRRNNVENVYLAGPSGTYAISVTAANLPADGAPGLDDQTDQSFALVISNATLAA
jgi:subtilisin family serine protease